METRQTRDGRLPDDDPGDPTGEAAVALQAGAARALEAALRQTEQRFGRLLETIHAYRYSVRVVDGRTVATDYDPACQAVTGYRPEEFAEDGSLWIDIVSPEDRPAVVSRAAEVLRGEVGPLEHRIVRRDGIVRWVHNAIVRHAHDGVLTDYDGIVEDITERKQLEDTLRRSRDFLHTVLDAIPETTVVVDREHRVVLANRAARQAAPAGPADQQPFHCRQLLCREEELAGRPCTLPCPVAEVFATGSPTMVTHTVSLPRGEEMVVEVSAAPIRDSGGNVQQVVMSCRDVTRRRQAERALEANEAQFLAAQHIQRHLLPHQPPQLPGFEIGGRMVAALYTSGDYFDFFPMPDATLGVAIGDVTGHGIGPALIMSLVHVLLRLLMESHRDLTGILIRANDVLTRETDEFHYVTLLLGWLDPADGSFRYANAGHPCGYVLDRDGRVKERLESTSHPLAMFADTKFSTAGTVVLQPGETLLLVTDGLEEARSPEGELFGKERLLETFVQNRHRPAPRIAHVLCRKVLEFAARETPEDDTTVVVVKALEPPQPGTARD